MPDTFEMSLLNACIRHVSAAMSDSEAIIAISKGRTRPGQQVFHFYKVDVAVLDNDLAGPPTNRRRLIVTINQDSPDQADVAPPGWEPWDDLYAM